jgi:hypothetical protein
MNTYIEGGLFGWPKVVQQEGPTAMERVYERREEEAEKQHELQRQEALIVKHMESATNQKYVVVDGVGHYIPKADAKRLGLI